MVTSRRRASGLQRGTGGAGRLLTGPAPKPQGGIVSDDPEPQELALVRRYVASSPRPGIAAPPLASLLHGPDDDDQHAEPEPLLPRHRRPGPPMTGPGLPIRG
jgi:hypothetical protein